MKSFSILIIIYALFKGSMNLSAQTTTDIELHNRYWTYRENFRKYFTIIGNDPGDSIPAKQLKQQMAKESILVGQMVLVKY